MEGTKHEKVVLIIMAYIIGFTSSFIAFGVTDYAQSNAVAVSAEAMPVDYMPPTEHPPVAESVTQHSDTEAGYEDGKLYATVRGERFVLSLHSDIVASNNVEGFSTQGIHEAIPTYSTSADGKYVYFCEKQTSADECASFIFDTEKNVIQPVSLNGKRFITPISNALTAAWQGDSMVIGLYSSASLATPWKLEELQ